MCIKDGRISVDLDSMTEKLRLFLIDLYPISIAYSRVCLPHRLFKRNSHNAHA